jgi:hypothetical protein
MDARDYRLRKAAGAEYTVGILFASIWVPWVLLEQAFAYAVCVPANDPRLNPK